MRRPAQFGLELARPGRELARPGLELARPGLELARPGRYRSRVRSLIPTEASPACCQCVTERISTPYPDLGVVGSS